MSDALRAYLRDLRIKRSLSQEKAADAIGWSIRSFSEWETGKSEDIKARYLIRLVNLLGASWDYVVTLELNERLGEEIELLHEQKSDPVAAQSNEQELQTLIDQLWSNDELRNAFLIFWAGWKAKK